MRMDTFIFKFDANRLRKMPPDYLGFLITSGHCCNELARSRLYRSKRQAVRLQVQ